MQAAQVHDVRRAQEGLPGLTQLEASCDTSYVFAMSTLWPTMIKGIGEADVESVRAAYAIETLQSERLPF